MLEISPYSIGPLNAHYTGSYSKKEYEWIELNATGKAKNISYILGDEKKCITTVLEVGCGAGFVLQNLEKLGIGSIFDGVDVVEVDQHKRFAPSANINFHRYDGTTLPFADKQFDFVYSTHVLEHVWEERAFLSELRRVARRLVYVEVPCELHIRSRPKTIQSTLNIGHINFYTPDSFFATLETTGLRIKAAEIFDHDINIYKFKKSLAKAYVSAFARGLMLKINKRIAAKLFCYHCGALCEP
jgi:SAM-dependent methyltransferase